MKEIFLLQWQRFRRRPFFVVSILFSTVLFIVAMGGFGGSQTVQIPIYFDDSITDEAKESWLNQLNKADGFNFFLADEKSARNSIALGEYSYAVNIMKDDYRILLLTEGEELNLIQHIVGSAFESESRISYAASQVDNQNFKNEVNEILSDPIIEVKKEAPGPLDQAPTYNHRLQILFGMTLFFSIYTIVISLSRIAQERITGTLKRIVLSPVKKWQVYLGHMGYSFIIGYIQILLIIILFKYAFNFEVSGEIGTLLVTIGCYVFATVALGMLLMGLTNSMEQLNAIVPIVSVSTAMIGGAYWPLDIVSNEIILTISKVVPVTYGMEALKAVNMYGLGWGDIAEPLAILILLGVLFMGIGVNLIERRA